VIGAKNNQMNICCSSYQRWRPRGRSWPRERPRGQFFGLDEDSPRARAPLATPHRIWRTLPYPHQTNTPPPWLRTSFMDGP